MDEISQRILNLPPEKRALLEKQLLNNVQRFRAKGSLDLIQRLPGEEKPSQVSSIHPVDRNRRIPLSYSQERMWFIHQMDPESAAYNMVAPVRMKGSLDVSILEQSLLHIARRHEDLRTTFQLVDGQPVQVIHSVPHFTFKVQDLSDFQPEEREEKVIDFINQEAQRPFDLEKGPLLRVFVYRMNPDDHILFMVMHHIISDAWSLGVISRELSESYNALSAGREPNLPNLPIQYADFALWQRDRLQNNDLDRQMEYWRRQLADVTVLDLPLDFPRPAIQTSSRASKSVDLSADLLLSLKKLSAKNNSTLFMTLLAAFKVLLYHYTNQSDIAIGVPIANRRWLDIEDLIGTFVNTLVLRTDLSGNPTFNQLLDREQKVALEAYAHQDLSFAELVAGLQLPRDLSRSPLFQVLFNVINVPLPFPQITGLDVSYVSFEGYTPQFDMTCTIIDIPEMQRIVVTYNSDLFRKETIERILDQYETLLSGIVTSPDLPVKQLPILSASERLRILNEWNDTFMEFPPEKTLSRLFEEQVERTPQKTAVQAYSLLARADTRVTYGELNQRANRLANYLRKLGIGPQTYICISMERNLEMMVGLLGILKAGGTYIPLDPAFPPERLAYMVQDSRAPVLITQQSLLSLLPDTESFSHLICLDRDWGMITQESSESVQAEIDPRGAAYILYTSGSTGKPKGVEIPHLALANFLLSMQREPGMSEQDVLLAVTTLSFDIAGLELYLPLISGARLVLSPREVSSDGHRLLRELETCGATVMQATPATWRMLIEAGWQGSQRLKILCGGEALPQDLAADLLARCGELWNMYGPTETTIWSTLARITSATDQITIGRPIANTRLYVLDSQGQPAPVGVTGELYIGGEGVALGYLNRPELTAERFLADPFSPQPGARMYRTGDLARYLVDGRVDLLGRMDQQVKLRGFRIELGEIEAVLGEHPAVNQAVAVVREDHPGDRRLVGYVTLSSPAAVGELREHARQFLPEYMVPGAFVILDAFPLTPNLKIDRKALPAPDITRSELDNSFISPRSDTEKQLASIWQDLLNVSPVGVQDNFFDLGGHSMLAVQMLARVQQEFKVNIPLTTLFQKANICQLAEVILEQRGPKNWSSLARIQPEGTRKPLFCVHGITGDVLWYCMLVPYLDPNQPVWGLESKGLEGVQQPLASIEEMAAYYNQIMRAEQPEGPYFISGYSFGGTVAFEMARQLQADGQEIGLLAIIDHANPKSNYYKVKLGPEFIKALFYNLPHRISDALRLRPDEFRGRVRRYLSRFRKMFLRLIGKAGQAGPKVDDLIDNGSMLPAATQAIIELNYQAMVDYYPKHYPGNVTLLRARGGRIMVSHESDMGWSKFADSVDVKIIPGSHLGLFREPNIKSLATQIQRCLDDAQA